MAPPVLANYHTRRRGMHRYPSRDELNYLSSIRSRMIDDMGSDARAASFLSIEVATIELSLNFTRSIMAMAMNPRSVEDDEEYDSFFATVVKLLTDSESLSTHGQKLHQLWSSGSSSAAGTLRSLRQFTDDYMESYCALEARRLELVEKYAAFLPAPPGLLLPPAS